MSVRDKLNALLQSFNYYDKS